MGTAARPNELRYLDPKVVARIGSMELRARTIVEGFLIGLHRSPYKGFSVEFSEYRPYMPGDDLSTIDWKVFGRSDRFYVKRYEEETNLDCRVLLDVSGSMSYRSDGVTKRDYGAYLAASLAYLMHRQRDAVGLVTFDDEIITNLPVSSRPGHLRRVLVTLDQLRPGRRSNLAKPLNRLADALGRRGMVVVISDLLDDPETVVRGLRHLRFRGTDVIVFHVLDPAELTFPFERATRFRDLETDAEVTTIASRARDPYLHALQDLLDVYRRSRASITAWLTPRRPSTSRSDRISPPAVSSTSVFSLPSVPPGRADDRDPDHPASPEARTRPARRVQRHPPPPARAGHPDAPTPSAGAPAPDAAGRGAAVAHGRVRAPVRRPIGSRPGDDGGRGRSVAEHVGPRTARARAAR